MFSIYELYNQSIPTSGDISLSLSSGNVNFDASDAKAIMYTINTPSWASGNGFDLIISGSTSWSVTIPISSPTTSGCLPVPSHVSWVSISVTLVNNTLSIANNVDFVVGISRTDDNARGTTLTDPSQSGIITNGMVFATSKNNTYPISLRSTNDGSMMVNPSIPYSVANLDGFVGTASIDGFKFVNWGNGIATTGSFARSLNIPIANINTCAVVPAIPPQYPSAASEYIIDIDTTIGCQVKFGSISFSISTSSIDIGFLKPQAYHLFRVTSATGAAGTLSLTIYGQVISGAVLAAATSNIQANNIANLINSNPQLAVRAVAFADRVYIRTLMNQLTGTNSVTTLYTVVSTPLVINTGETDTSVKISGNAVAQRRETFGSTSYRMWVRPDMVTCYRRNEDDFPTWSFVGNTGTILQPRGYDGDLIVYNSPNLGTTSPKQINSVRMYTKQAKPPVTASFEIIRSITAFAQTTLLGFMQTQSITGMFLSKISVQNTTSGTAVIRVICDAVLPTTVVGVTEYSGGRFIATSATVAGIVTSNVTIGATLIGPGVTNILYDHKIAPFSVYAILVDNDPAATAKTGRIGIIATFEELA